MASEIEEMTAMNRTIIPYLLPLANLDFAKNGAASDHNRAGASP